METEKITINLGAVDLGQIDLLVDQGFYSNRTDFIRTAIRTALASHANDINGFKSSDAFGIKAVEDRLSMAIENKINRTIRDKLNDAAEKIERSTNDISSSVLGGGFAGTGLVSINAKDLETIKSAGKKINIKMVGMLIISDDVSPELALQTLGSVKVYGVLKASAEIKKVIDKLKS